MSCSFLRSAPCVLRSFLCVLSASLTTSRRLSPLSQSLFSPPLLHTARTTSFLPAASSLRALLFAPVQPRADLTSQQRRLGRRLRRRLRRRLPLVRPHFVRRPPTSSRVHAFPGHNSPLLSHAALVSAGQLRTAILAAFPRPPAPFSCPSLLLMPPDHPSPRPWSFLDRRQLVPSTT